MAVPDIKSGECLTIYTRFPLEEETKESSVFLLCGNEWNFKLTNCGFEHDYEAYIQLKNNEGVFQPFEIDYEVGFKYDEEPGNLGFGSKKIKEESELFWFIDECHLEFPYDYGQGNFLMFKIYFQFDTEPVLVYSSKSQDTSVQTSPYMDAFVLSCGTAEDFSKLLQEDFGHDIKLICGDEIIKAHKVILCCRSSIFAAKLKGRTDGVSELKIENVDGDIFKQFISYLYTGMLPELTIDNAILFYKVAVEYSVDTLKRQCASFLIENLSSNNAIEILKMADHHGDMEFKECVMDYMIEENIFLIGEKWTDFCRENPALSNEVLNVQQPSRKKPRFS